MLFPNGLKRDKYCKQCGMYKHCKSPRMEGEGHNTPTYLFVMEAPGAEEDDIGIPAWGDAGSLLRKAIEDIGIDMQKCRFDNCVKCHPKDNNLKVWPNAPELCKPHILAEIEKHNPKIVVAIGAYAISSLLEKKGVLKLHGEVFKTKERIFVAMFHPAYLLRNNTLENQLKFKQALQIVKELGEGKATKKNETWIPLSKLNAQDFLHNR